MKKMKLDQKIIGAASFTFEYFTKGGYIGCTCPNCSSSIKLNIEIYKSGHLIEMLDQESNSELISELIDKKIINLKHESNKWNSGLKKYILWNMNARYELFQCITCDDQFISVFGMGELQPGREEVQFKGIWKVKCT